MPVPTDESLHALETVVKNLDGVPCCTGTFPWDTKKSTLFYKSNEVEPRYVQTFLNVSLIHALSVFQVPQFPGSKFSARVCSVHASLRSSALMRQMKC